MNEFWHLLLVKNGVLKFERVLIFVPYEWLVVSRVNLSLKIFMVVRMKNFVKFYTSEIIEYRVTILQFNICYCVVVNIIVNYFPCSLQGINTKISITKRASPPDCDSIGNTAIY